MAAVSALKYLHYSIHMYIFYTYVHMKIIEKHCSFSRWIVSWPVYYISWSSEETSRGDNKVTSYTIYICMYVQRYIRNIFEYICQH